MIFPRWTGKNEEEAEVAAGPAPFDFHGFVVLMPNSHEPNYYSIWNIVARRSLFALQKAKAGQAVEWASFTFIWRSVF